MTIDNIPDAIDEINRAFVEYKAANDKRLAALAAGNSTSDIDARLDRIDQDLQQLSELKSQLERVETRMARAAASVVSEQGETPAQTEYRAAFLDWVRSPTDQSRQQRCQRAALELRSTAVVTSTGSAGGYALPEQIEAQIGAIVTDISPIRQIATVRTVGTTDYKELLDIGGTAGEWLGEGDTRNQTNTPDLAEVAPTFGTVSAKPQASEESLDDLFFDVESWLMSSISTALAALEGAAFVSGNGTKKPTGFLTGTPVATADGSRAFGELQYTASGQASAMPTNYDTFYDLVYSLRAGYRGNARWVCPKSTLRPLRKYKDSTGQYLWQPSLVAGQPDAFLGYPVTECEDMPAVTAGAFPLAFGDFRAGYLIVDRVGMRVTRDEITTPGYVKFYCRRRVGGKIRDSLAIKLLKIAAS